jgi:hypothetical protein
MAENEVSIQRSNDILNGMDVMASVISAVASAEPPDTAE